MNKIGNNTQWKTPNRNLIKKVVKYFMFFSQNDPQFRISGKNNLWIMKPGGNARG